MSGGNSTEDRGPWFEVAGHPVATPLALVAFFILSMLVTTTVLAFNHSWATLLLFSSEAVMNRGEVWRVVSYALWNPPSLALALDMLMLWWFGRELEAFFGRRVFLKLCAGIVLVPAFAGLLAGVFSPVQWVGLPGTFALFVAFATMAPNVTLLFGISAKWTAIVFLSIQLLSCLAEHAWGQLIHSLASAGFAFVYICFQLGRWEFPNLRMGSLKGSPKGPLKGGGPKNQGTVSFKVLETVPIPVQKKGEAPKFRVVEEEPDALDEIDHVLEKIGKSGMASLNEAERAQLQVARDRLMKKDGVRR